MRILMEHDDKVYELIRAESGRGCALSGEGGCPACIIGREKGGYCRGASALGKAFRFEEGELIATKAWGKVWERD